MCEDDFEKDLMRVFTRATRWKWRRPDRYDPRKVSDKYLAWKCQFHCHKEADCAGEEVQVSSPQNSHDLGLRLRG